MRHLVFVLAVRVHHPDFERVRLDEVLREELLVAPDLGGRPRVVGAVDDVPAVAREEGAAVVAQLVS